MVWSFGLNKSIPVVNLTSENCSSIFYASSNVGVIYDYIENKQVLLQGHVCLFTNEITCSADNAVVISLIFSSFYYLLFIGWHAMCLLVLSVDWYFCNALQFERNLDLGFIYRNLFVYFFFNSALASCVYVMKLTVIKPAIM